MMLAGFDRSLEYAMKRVQFGKPIVEHQLIQAKLARMAMLIEASRSMIYRVASLVDDYVKGRIDPKSFAALSSATKVFATNSATEVLDEAIQIHGGYGYVGEFDVERYWRDHRVTRIYEGTDEVNLLTIADSLRRGSWRP